jgi:hypothetical protein
MLAGGFGVFIIGPVLDKWGIAWGFFVTFATGTLWSVLQFVPLIPAQGFSWVTFAFYRAFFFSVIASYMVAVFGYANMGKVYGFCNVVAAACSIFNNMVLFSCTFSTATQNLLHLTCDAQVLEWVFQSAGGSFKEVNAVFMGLQLLQFLFVWCLAHPFEFISPHRRVSSPHLCRYVHVKLKGAKVGAAAH